MTQAFIFSFMLAITLAACNTMEGAGKDIKGAGDSLENAARKNKP